MATPLLMSTQTAKNFCANQFLTLKFRIVNYH